MRDRHEFCLRPGFRLADLFLPACILIAGWQLPVASAADTAVKEPPANELKCEVSASHVAEGAYVSTTPVCRNDAWWVERYQAKLVEVRERPDIDLVMLGDSITHSWENGGKEIWEKYYAKRNALNIGFSGDRTEHVLWRLQHDAVDGIQPRLVVLMIGTNNAGHSEEDPLQTAAGIRAILDELAHQVPDAQVLVLAIFPRGTDQHDAKRKLNDQTNQIIRGYADGKRVHFLDIKDIFLSDDGTLLLDLMPDALHPNTEGYEKWAEAIEPTLSRLLEE